jgi:hypothetical protein
VGMVSFDLYFANNMIVRRAINEDYGSRIVSGELWQPR